MCVCVYYTHTHILSPSVAQQLTLSPGLFNNLPNNMGWGVECGKMDHGYQELYKVVKLERGKIGLNQFLI